MAWLLTGSAFLAACLAFLVEPMVARMLLPTYGGTSAVWTTALVFFQAMLVAGYAWAHAGPRRLGTRRHAVLQVGLVVVALLLLPVAAPGWARPPLGVAVGPWLLATLALMVGLPFLALAANGPTVQRWYATTVADGDAPYRLFAASNAGSLVGLLAYPLIVEPNLDLVDQGRWWTAAFAAFAVLTLIAAVVVARRPAPAAADAPVAAAPSPLEASPWRGRRTWLVLAAIPVATMVGVTAHLSIDVAAVPLMWVVPLAIYLVTMILAYARAKPLLVVPARRALAPVAVLAVATHAGFLDVPIAAAFAIHLGGLFVVGLALHGTLAADRPGPTRLTEYWLFVAVGGAVGGIAAGVLGPLVLPLPWEEPVALLLAVLVTAGLRRPPRLAPWAFGRAAFAPAAVATVLVAALVTQPAVLASVRTFYGTYRVVAEGDRHVLYAGTTIHGIQDRAPGREKEPWAYYSRQGPLGQVLATSLAAPRPLRIGVVGLGSGAVAAYGRPGDSIEFLEIDPAVVTIAEDPRLFSYLGDSAAAISVAIGDGRILLEDREPATYDILVLDAFSSDAIPVHMLTVEGLDVAMSRVRTDGFIAIHVSNRYLELERIVAAAARELGLVAIIGTSLPGVEEAGLAEASQWVVVAREYRYLAALVEGPDWRTAHAGGGRPWTDRWSDLLARFADAGPTRGTLTRQGPGSTLA